MAAAFLGEAKHTATKHVSAELISGTLGDGKREVAVHSIAGEPVGITFLRMPGDAGGLGWSRRVTNHLYVVDIVQPDSVLAGLVLPGDHIICIDGGRPKWLEDKLGAQRLSAMLLSREEFRLTVETPQIAEPLAFMHGHRRVQARKPIFRSLPTSLMWPNPEVFVVMVFSPGLLQCSIS